MRQLRILIEGVLSILLVNCTNSSQIEDDRKECVASADSIEILREVIDSAKDEYDIAEVALWLSSCSQ